MSVNDQPSTFSYVGDGISVDFAFPSYLAELSHLVVTLVNIATGIQTPQVSGVHYTIAGTLIDGVYPDGATVTMLAAPSSAYRVTLNRRTPLTQDATYQPNDRFPAKTHEHAVDKPILILQDRLSGLQGMTSGKPTGVGVKGQWYLSDEFTAGGVFAWTWCETDVDGAAVNDWRPVGGISLL